MRVLITGVAGFVGSHLAEYLLGLKGVEVHGVDRWQARRDNLAGILNRITYHECDLRDFSGTLRLIQAVKPERIFHLAAQSFVPMSWTAPGETLDCNIQSQVNLFEACRTMGISPRIEIACSSEEYGLVLESEGPIRETNPLRPLSPYGVSKVAQDFLAYQYWMSYQLPVVRTRAFNHTGPRRGEQFVTSNFAKQIAEAEKGVRKPEISVGNLDAKRDFTDARDIVRAYWLALEKGEPGEVYNICTGTAYTIRAMLDVLLGMATVKVKVVQDPARMRPSDVLVLLGDCTKFKARTGWAPEIPFEQTMRDLLNYWRERV